MLNLVEPKMTKRYTDELLRCVMCQRGNNFTIEIKQQGDREYFLTKCPKCGHYEEVRPITPKEASRYRNTTPSSTDVE